MLVNHHAGSWNTNGIAIAATENDALNSTAAVSSYPFCTEHTCTLRHVASRSQGVGHHRNHPPKIPPFAMHLLWGSLLFCVSSGFWIILPEKNSNQFLFAATPFIRDVMPCKARVPIGDLQAEHWSSRFRKKNPLTDHPIPLTRGSCWWTSLVGCHRSKLPKEPRKEKMYKRECSQPKTLTWTPHKLQQVWNNNSIRHTTESTIMTIAIIVKIIIGMTVSKTSHKVNQNPILVAVSCTPAPNPPGLHNTLLGSPSSVENFNRFARGTHPVTRTGSGKTWGSARPQMRGCA